MKFRKEKKKEWERNTHVRSVEVKKNIYIARYGRKQIEAYLSGTYQKKNWRTSQTTRRTVVRWYALMLHPE